MQAIQHRCLILIGVLAAGAWLLAAVGGPQPLGSTRGTARWPTDDALSVIDDWTMSRSAVDAPPNGVAWLYRDYRRSDGMTVSVAVATSPEVDRIYRAGADVPFRGSGYTVDPAPSELVPTDSGRGGLLVRGGQQQWLVLYAYGERRGLLGNGALGWGTALADAIRGRPNDYFKAYVVALLDRPGSPTASDVVELADTLFPQLSAWYGDNAASVGMAQHIADSTGSQPAPDQPLVATPDRVVGGPGTGTSSGWGPWGSF